MLCRLQPRRPGCVLDDPHRLQVCLKHHPRSPGAVKQVKGFVGLRSGGHGHSVQAYRYPDRQQLPSGNSDVDEELWGVLDICNDEELESIHSILYGSSMLSPVVKSLVGDSEPPAIQWKGRASIMRRIDSRFRFLAADATSTLRGRRPSYRETLVSVRDRLQVQCPGGLATQDLESEIFLHLLQQQASAMQGLADSIDASQAKLRSKRRSPAEMLQDRVSGLLRSVRLGAPEMRESVVKFASALSMNGLRQTTLRQLAQQLLLQRSRYQAAVTLVCRSGTSTLQREATLKAAQSGLTNAAAKYGAAQGALSILGPLMWTWLALDLALNSIGTDFQRITKAIFLLAQVRLTRTQGFINPA